MKKLSLVAVAVCLFVGSSFAAWDYFPPKEAGKGQARLNFNYAFQDELSVMDLAVKGRYSIIEGLEAALTLPIPLSMSIGDYSVEKYAGLASPEIGVRYWLPMGLGFYLDFALPVDTREWMENEVHMNLGVGAQFSMNFTEELSIGSQLGLGVPFADKDEYKDGLGLVVGAELDYSIGPVTPFLGAELGVGLTKPTYKGDEAGDAAGVGVDLWIGAAYSINDMFGVDLSVNLGVTEDPLPIKISFDLDFNF